MCFKVCMYLLLLFQTRFKMSKHFVKQINLIETFAKRSKNNDTSNNLLHRVETASSSAPEPGELSLQTDQIQLRSLLAWNG